MARCANEVDLGRQPSEHSKSRRDDVFDAKMMCKGRPNASDAFHITHSTFPNTHGPEILRKLLMLKKSAFSAGAIQSNRCYFMNSSFVLTQ